MIDIAKVLQEHAEWSADNSKGKRADLRGADLRRANLSEANLTGADLRRANLSEANLTGADLSRANLSEADLDGANLTGANLRGATLSGASLSRANLDGANLSGASLHYCVGDATVIRTFITEPWTIVWTADTLAIGCQQHLITSWEAFTDKQISNMDNKALTWWLTNKATVLSLVKGGLQS